MSDFQNILVPTDPSPHSEAALAKATSLALAFKAKLHLLLVYYKELPPMPKGEVEIPNDYWGTNEAGARAVVEDAAKTISSEHSLKAVAYIREGDPDVAIARLATEIHADLIVMGSRGRTGLNHFFMGSVTERTIRIASCPVMVVKDQEADKDFESHYLNEIPRRP